MENIPKNSTTSRDNFLSNFPNHRLRIAFIANLASAGFIYVLSERGFFNHAVGQIYQKMKGNEP